ncbi:zinc finger, CCHC-type containing protein [Tanacetum coccineum]
MQFLLATLKVAYVLTKPYLEESKNETLAASRERLKFENDDFICRGHILNAMSDPPFDVYQNYSTAKELWNALEERYFTEDATNVKKNLKLRKDDLSIKDLDKHLLIEEQYHLENKTNDETSKVHVVEEKGVSSKAGGKKRRHDDKDKKKSKKNKRDVICYNCKKPGYFKREYCSLKKKQDGGNDNKNKDNNFVAMISEAFSLEEDKSWWVDSRATRHVCNDQTMFKTYEPLDSMLYMGNHSTAQVKGKGKIDLVFTSGNTLTLKNVLHVPDVRKNLVSGSLLNKFGFKLVFESDKFILSKGGKFVGKGYHTGGMFKLNIKDVVNSSVNDVNMTEISDANDASVEIPITTEGNNDDSFPNHQQVEPRRSTRQRRLRTFGPDFEMYLVKGDRKGLIREYPIIYNLDEDPQTYSEAMKSHDSSFWKEAVNDEMDSIIGNNTWILVDLPPGSKAIKSKWIFKRKLRIDGSIEKFKTRLVAKGFTQREGLD